MQCVICPSKPKLTFKTPSVTDTERNCNGCGIELKKTKNIFKCLKCEKYILCQNCRICSKKHYLKKVIYLENTNIDYKNNRYGCNFCGKVLTADDRGVWHCGVCTYDVCPTCLE